MMKHLITISNDRRRKRIALPVAGHDPAAKAVVMTLLDEIGFDGVDAGPIAESWRQQPGTPTYCTDLDRAGVIQALAIVGKSHAPARRDQFIQQMLLLTRQGAAPDLISPARPPFGAGSAEASSSHRRTKKGGLSPLFHASRVSGRSGGSPMSAGFRLRTRRRSARCQRSPASSPWRA